MSFNTQFSFSRTLLASAMAVVMSSGLSGCITTEDDEGIANTTVVGTAVAGAVDGTVTVTDAAGNQVVVGTVTNGLFSVSIPNSELAKLLHFVVTGSYVDEASGETVSLSAEHPLALSIEANYFNSGELGHAPVSPGSTVIYQLMNQQGMSLADAKVAFQNAFGYLPDMDAIPFDSSLLDEAVAELRPQADKDAAFRAGALSQLANDLGLSGDDIAALLAGLAEDLADGDLDGLNTVGAAVEMGSIAPINLKVKQDDKPLDARLIQAYGAFAGSDRNVSGLAAPSMGLPTMAYDLPGTTKQVTLVDGRIVDVTLGIDYDAPFMNGFWTARTDHKITLIDSSDGSVIDAATDAYVKGVVAKPFMYMLTGHNHSTPHEHMADNSTSGDGVYNLNAYYLMASAMGMGDAIVPMGVWQYTVKIKQDTDADGEADTPASLVFHPQVKMPMDGSVLFSKLNNVDHTWTNMMGMPQAREYRVWLHEVSANSNSSHDVSVFVSTQNMADMGMMAGMGMHMGGDHDMMKFPAAYSGQVLNGPVNMMNMRPELTLASVVVEVSNDEGSTWATMNETADSGLFSRAELVGLSSTEANTLAFRVTVNDGSSDYVMTTAAGGNGELVFVAPSL